MNRFLVFRNYGTEGWQIVSEHAEILDAVLAREDELRYKGGGEVIIVSYHSAIEAYRAAHFAWQQRNGERTKQGESHGDQ